MNNEMGRDKPCHLTACHAACIHRQRPRRHPWRKSRPMQVGASCAPGSDGQSLAGN